ncbi:MULTISPECIES: enoyl-CoA hydratase [unclassified Variovorax]|uniref:enoyl-CoA hydratase n=1 Tax=unclassified Variovorax TaxID=663243 RepID=UPI001BD3BCAC|nr:MULTISPECIES: enoyl-CoA hydratase [unclassified Variovorax]
MNNMPEYEHATLAMQADGIATVTIRSANALNIIGTPVIDDVRQAISQLAAESEVRVLVLRGAGDRAFVGGADIREMGALDVDSARVFIDKLRGLCEAVRLFPSPVIARLSGWALGGGLELAAACDLRIASNRAQLGMPEVKVGIPSIIHAALLPRLIGQARANWLLMTGDNIDAAQALAWGLVDIVVPQERLDDEVERMARKFAGYGPSVMRQQKRLLREWQQEPLESSIRNGVEEFASAYATGEPQRFMAAFLKRK